MVNAVYASSDAIDTDGVVLWHTNRMEGKDSTRDFRQAELTNSPYVSSFGFHGLYFAALVGMIMNDKGEVHVKALTLLEDALVDSGAGHPRKLAEYLETAPPGKYAVGQMAYIMIPSGRFVRVLVEAIETAVKYDAKGSAVKDLTYTLVEDRTAEEDQCEYHLPETKVFLLPNNIHLRYSEAMANVVTTDEEETATA